MKKKMDIHTHQYPSDICPRYDQLKNYVEGKLGEEASNVLERALDCCGEECFCKTLLEGMEIAILAQISLEKEPQVTEEVNHAAIFQLIQQWKEDKQKGEDDATQKKSA